MLRRMRPAAPVNLVNNVCSISLKKLQTYLPLLGFILRSTNVRNAFEAYPPLLRLARRLLGADTQLILSSEWDFIPVIYHSIRALPKYVLIGFPAPESSNPLLIPLAGHELGHSVWKSPENQPIRESFDEKINNGIVHEIITTWWAEYESIYSKEGFTRTDVEQGHKETVQDLGPCLRLGLSTGRRDVLRFLRTSPLCRVVHECLRISYISRSAGKAFPSVLSREKAPVIPSRRCG